MPHLHFRVIYDFSCLPEERAARGVKLGTARRIDSGRVKSFCVLSVFAENKISFHFFFSPTGVRYISECQVATCKRKTV